MCIRNWGGGCSVVQSCLLFVTPWTAACQVSLFFTISRSLLKFSVHWVGDPIQPSHSLSSSSPPAFNLSQHRVSSKELALHPRRSKYWSFNFSISPSNEYLRLISFRIDWFDLLAVQGALKSLLQHHNSKASVLHCSTFFMVQPRVGWELGWKKG